MNPYNAEAGNLGSEGYLWSWFLLKSDDFWIVVCLGVSLDICLCVESCLGVLEFSWTSSPFDITDTFISRSELSGCESGLGNDLFRSLLACRLFRGCDCLTWLAPEPWIFADSAILLSGSWRDCSLTVPIWIAREDRIRWSAAIWQYTPWS